MPGFGVAKSPQGRAIRRQAPPNIFESCEACCGFLRMRDLREVPDREAPLARPRLSCRNENLAHGAGMTLQFVRPDIRQSCILLAAVKS